MPTLVAIPWPSGPVVVSTPDVQRYSGWPRQRLPSWRNVLMSSRETEGLPTISYSGSTALTPVRCSIVEQHRCVPGGKHETVAIRPDRILGIKPEKVLPQTITTGAIPIGVPGCPEVAC